MAEAQQIGKHSQFQQGDASEPQWDDSILRAPDSHKSEIRKAKRHKHQQNMVKRVLMVILAIIGIIAGVCAAIALGLLIALTITGNVAV